MVDPVLVNELLGAVHDCLHVVDSHALVGGKVRVAVNRKEEVPTAVVSIDDGTYTSFFDRYLAANVAAVTFYLTASICASTMLILNLIMIKLWRLLPMLGWRDASDIYRDSCV